MAAARELTGSKNPFNHQGEEEYNDTLGVWTVLLVYWRTQWFMLGLLLFFRKARVGKNRIRRGLLRFF